MIYKHFFKRFIDISISLLGIILLSPILIILLILVKTKLGSPVIYKHNRPGKNEKEFTLYKFRSMSNKKDAEGNLLPDAQRMTKFGMKLRATSLDELPELFNILKGDMSIIGPRPLLIRYLPYYTDKERIRHSIRPGLTGLAQVEGRNNLPWNQRLQYDINYVENLSFKNDLSIFFRTISKVISHSDIEVPGSEKFEEIPDLDIDRKK